MSGKEEEPTIIPFWKSRSKHGRDKIFSSPEMLWESACGYFEWVEDNPLKESKAFSFQGESWIEQVPKMRAMTLNGLCLYLGCDNQTLSNYGSKKGYEDYFGIVSLIKSTIYEQKFTGAAADLLNSNIIARDLGLREKQEVDNKSSDGSMSPSFNKELYDEAQSKLDELD